MLADVLADLVDDGTITQQPDAITDAVDTRLAARRSEMEQRHQEMRAAAEQIRGFLEDEDHPG